MVYKNIIICQARMGSSRLPGKSLMAIWNDMSLLEVVLKRLSRAKSIDRVIMATTTNELDDPLIPIAENCGADVFRGSENDVLGRFVGALEKNPAEAVVRASADNPFLDPNMIDSLTKFFWENFPCDYTMNLGPMTGFPDSTGAEMVSADTLRRLNKLELESHHREHVLTYIHDNPEFKSIHMRAPDEYRRPQYRIDIDFQEDMDFIRELIKLLPAESAPYWTTKEIIATLDKNNGLLSIRKQR